MRSQFSSVLVLLFTMCRPLSAQTTSPTEEAPRGTTKIVVTRTDDLSIDGRLLELSDDSVMLLSKGRREMIPFDRVALIETARDSSKDGAIRGAVILGAWCLNICSQGLDEAGDLSAAVFYNALFGGAIGWLFDAANTSRQVIYRRPGYDPKTDAIGRRVSIAARWRF
jgi:hypothetical protein